MTAEMLQQLNLTQAALSQNLLAEDIGDLLDSDTLVGGVVGSGADDTVSALA